MERNIHVNTGLDYARRRLAAAWQPVRSILNHTTSPRPNATPRRPGLLKKWISGRGTGRFIGGH